MDAQLPISMARIIAAALLLAGCLPGDTRPPPAAIHLTVEPSPAVTDGLTTVDGWHISFERLLLGIGDARLGALGSGNADPDESVCTIYANARYERLFDVTVGGRQPLSDIYGIGTCGVSFAVTVPYGWSGPLGATPLGPGVSAKDLAFMRDSSHHTLESNHPRSVYVRGQATRDTTTKRFEWSFRDLYVLRGCVDASGVGYTSDVILTSGAELPLPVVIHGEELFRASGSDDSPLRFDALAAADADGDHVITLEELHGTVDAVSEANGGAARADGGPPSLADLLEYQLVPRMMRLRDSGPCVGLFQ
ncbi:MAG: hypothetical protein ABJE95_08140 [Byssovorax sp.]